MATFENLRLQRLIVHEVVLASALDDNLQPVMSQTLTELDPSGLQLVSRRLAEALGTESHSIEVRIEETGTDSAFHLATSLFEADNTSFVSISHQLANKLSRAQTVGSIKSGVAVIIQALIGSDAAPHRLVAIVKAESDAAFVKRNSGQEVTLEFVKEMVFGAQQRLFKIAAIVERPGVVPNEAADPSDFEVVVYDHQMNIKGEGSAAQYFYRTFLGATMVASTPQINKRFFEATGQFIANSNRNRDERSALRSDLISYLRSNETTVSGRQFGERYLRDNEERRQYLAFLHRSQVPRGTFEKDTRFFAHQLKIRRLTFAHRIHLSAPAEGFDRLVQVMDSTPEATTLRIAGALIDES